jgi:hypothetical protein
MDPTNFRNGMHLLALLPSPNGPITPEGIKTRHEGYKLLFLNDDGPLFEAACRHGVSELWKFYPAPKEIRDEMAAVAVERDRNAERRTYAALIARSEAHEEAKRLGDQCPNAACGLCRDEQDKRSVSMHPRPALAMTGTGPLAADLSRLRDELGARRHLVLVAPQPIDNAEEWGAS